MNRVELKEKAKEALKGKYSEAIIVLLIFGILGALSSGISSLGDALNNSYLAILGNLISFIITCLLSFGSLSFFLKISRGEDVDFKELFSKTNMAIPYLLISLLTGIFTLLWSILFIIPGIIAALGYSQTYLIVLDNPEMDPMAAIKESKRLMNGHKLDFLILNFSFFGWIILGIFTFGLLYLWLIPYMSVTQMNFYNALIEENK
jgi:uncharacterized membrane protein